MTLLADEGVDREIVERLRSDGHDVAYVAEMEPGTSDEAVLARANAAGAILLTQDKDFGDLVFRQGSITSGVVLLRMAGIPASSKAAMTSDAIREHGAEMSRAFAVVSPGSVRIRRP